MATSNYGVVSVTQPPLLKAVDQPSLIKFETSYAAYKAKVDDVNKDRDENSKLSLASIKDCMDSATLHALCLIGEIGDASTVEEAISDMVKVWFEKASTSTQKDLSERIDATLRHVTFKPNREDSSGSVANFIVHVITALDRNNASEVLKDGDMAKKFLDRLVNKFQPSVLQERIKMLRRGRTKSQLADIKLFKDEVAHIALELSLTETALSRVNPQKSKQLHDRPRKQTSTAKVESARRREASQNRRPNLRLGKRKNSEWSEPCLNEECDGIHCLKDCPITSTERKKEIFETHYRKKDVKKAKTMRDSCISTTALPDSDASRFRVALEDTVFDLSLGDSGADFSAIDHKVYNRLISSVPNLPVKNFENPVYLTGVFKSNEDPDTRSSRSVTLTVTVFLPGSSIPVRVRGVEFYVVDNPLEEILLGRPFLNSIGFNLNEHLVRVKNEIHDKHVNQLDTKRAKLATARYQGMSYMSADEDPIKLPECLAAGIGKDTKESIDKAFEKILAEARGKGLSNDGMKKMSAILNRYRDVFRIKLGADPAVDVPPLTITPVENAKPYRSSQRRYAPQQREFIIRTIRELEAMGAIYKNPSARWASPALAVPKPGSTKLRFTVDLRGPNARTVPIQSAMPHLESHFQDLSGSTCFPKIDLAHGYWQVPLSAESQEMMFIQTPIGVYSSKRLLQGGSDSGNHFQAVLSNKFEGRVSNFLQWIDDFLLYAKSEEDLLANLETFFLVCEEIGLKIHAEKTTLFACQVQFCGRIISAEGVQYHLRHYAALTEMRKHSMASELQQFVCATNWMRNSIPAYSERIAPLHQLLESCYAKAGKRTKRALRNLSITDSWGAELDSAFADIKNQLTAAVKLAHPKHDHHLCLFTDASDTRSSAILTQVPASDRHKAIEEQQHEPLCFLSGSFTGSAVNWSVPEKEGFAIVESMCRLDYLVTGRKVNIFTDHANLVYLYDPYGRNPGISRQTASKLMRWAIKLSGFRYVVEHLPGVQNLCADMLTRWAVNPTRTVVAAKMLRCKALMVAPINPGTDTKLDWPDIHQVKEAQSSTEEVPPKGFTKTEDGIRNERDILWVPSDSDLLKLRIVVAAHTGSGGGKSSKVTLATTKAFFYWKNMDDDLKSFVKICLHCLCIEPAKTIPRPLGHALHAEKPNELLHFDFCYMSPGQDDLLYVLVLKDDHSGYVWLVPTTETTAEVVADELIRWFAAFGVVTQWISDRGSHFKNEVARHLKEKTNSSHHFTLAYCPWSNGTVEVVCRELLRACRALLSEFQLPQNCWTSILPVVQADLNSSILGRLGNRCPLTVFTDHRQDTPLSAITKKVGGKTRILSPDNIRGKQLRNIEETHKALCSMHKEVAERSTDKRRKAVESHNRNTNVRAQNFQEGDFVLRGVLERERTRKPSLKWMGPFRVVECRSEYIFVIESLLDGQKQEVYGRRLKFFRNREFEVTEELRNYLSYQQGELLVIDRFEDIRLKRGLPSC